MVKSAVTRCIVIGATLAVTLLVTSVAQADSLVFARPDGNIWLAHADGTGLYQVTLDGTPASPYEAPSQADDGTIVTTRGRGPNEVIHRLTQNGTVLGSFRPIQFTLGVFDAQVSPDGSKIVYWTGYVGNSTCQEVTPGTPGGQFCYTSIITPSTGAGDLGGDLGFRTNAKWMSNSRLVMSGRNYHLSTYDIGAPAEANWVTSGGDYHNPEASSDGRRLATTAGFDYEVIQLFEIAGNPLTDGPPPAQPVPVCYLQFPYGGQFEDPTWAPRGDILAWQEGDGDSSTPAAPGEGIWIWRLGNTGVLGNDCNAPGPDRVAIQGATDPDFGPANVDPKPRETPAPPPRSTPTPTPPAPDRTKPAFVGSFALTPASFAAATRGPSIEARRTPGGAKVSYGLSEAASVTFTVERSSAGRRVGGRCVKPTRSNRRRPRCDLYTQLAGSFTHPGQLGTNTLEFSGRVAGRGLSRGSYRLVAIARDAAGNASDPKRVAFRVIKPRR